MFRFPVKNFQSILKNVPHKTVQVNKYQISAEKTLPAQADVVIIGELQNDLNKKDKLITFRPFYSLYLLKRWWGSRLLYTLPFSQAWHSGCFIGKISAYIRNNMVLSTLFLIPNNYRIEENLIYFFHCIRHTNGLMWRIRPNDTDIQ